MVRRIIEIDQEKCNGCGACAAACHEGAIGMANGKAVLLRDDYCDGLGDCLPTCPTGAITFVEREAAAYDAAAVAAAQGIAPQPSETVAVGSGGATERGGLKVNCPSGARETPLGDCDDAAAVLVKKAEALKGSAPVTRPGCPGSRSQLMHTAGTPAASAAPAVNGPVSCLMQWPVQIKLLPVEAPYYNGAKLLIAADCTAFSRADFHQRFMRGRITMIGCPKLDEGDYAEKLTEILRRNDVREVTIVRMEVPCCGGLQRAAETALRQSGKFIPWQVVTLGRDGNILD